MFSIIKFVPVLPFVLIKIKPGLARLRVAGRLKHLNYKEKKMPFDVTIKQLLEAGVHFGHQTKRWNPKMKNYIYGSRNGIHIVDLQKALPYIEAAYNKIYNVTREGGVVLFIGTKKQANPIVVEEATRCGMPYVSERWLGGMLTNFATIKLSIRRLKELEQLKASEEFQKFTKKEMSNMDKEVIKLQKVINGIRNLDKIPDAVFIVDLHHELTAAKEAKRLGISIIAVADTNADPDFADYLIPGNDDAIRSIKLILSTMANAALEGKKAFDERFNKKASAIAGAAQDITEETFGSQSVAASADNASGEDADVSI